MRKKTIRERIRKTRRSKRPCLYRMVHGKRVHKSIRVKSRLNKLTGDCMREKSVKYIRKAVMFCAGVTAAGVLLLGTQVRAEETGQFHSRGAVQYTNAAGQEVILDARDLQVLFQYAAEGKGGLSEALGGVGTKLTGDGQSYQYTRDPAAEASIGRLGTAEELQAVSFDLLLQALAESQTLPAGYEESYTLACADNMTLGRAAWADGSLARGNNRDLIEHYVRGWLEGSGCTSYEAVYDEEGRWIGYREK